MAQDEFGTPTVILVVVMAVGYLWLRNHVWRKAMHHLHKTFMGPIKGQDTQNEPSAPQAKPSAANIFYATIHESMNAPHVLAAEYKVRGVVLALGSVACFVAGLILAERGMRAGYSAWVYLVALLIIGAGVVAFRKAVHMIQAKPPFAPLKRWWDLPFWMQMVIVVVMGTVARIFAMG